MKKHSLYLFFLLLSLITTAYAGGGMSHMYVAEKTIALLPDKSLRLLLENNKEAYLAGAYYPDSGYVRPNLYGEDSHWNPFIYTFADYIKEKYQNPAVSNPKLVAFLFGCAVHSVSDIIMHWTFYNVSKEKDFDGDWNEAHHYGDAGIDLLLNIDKNQWFTHPITWWVPLSDLLAIYHRMGKDQYTRDQIIWGTSVTYLAGYGERAISAPSYPYLKWKMPWTAAHYEDWPQGGLDMDEKKVAVYLTNLWARLNTSKTPTTHEKALPQKRDEAESPFFAFAASAVKSKTAIVPITKNQDGSILVNQPIIENPGRFAALLDALLKGVTT